MKKLLKHSLTAAMIAGAVISVLIAEFADFAKECERIPDKVLRLHIIAESNSNEAQTFKLELRDYILENYASELKDCDSLAAACERSLELLPEIETTAREFAAGQGASTQITAEITKMYFPTRVYDSGTLPAGNYTALRITIGEGEGENWWCVMFPLLCIPACTVSESPQTVPVINLPESVTDSPKIKFAVFEFFAGLFRY